MREIPHSASDLEQIYEKRFSGAEEYRRQVWQTLTAKVFSRWVSPDAAVLDLGCGYCEFINNIQARVKYAMDLNPAARQHAAPGVYVQLQDCSAPWQLPPATLDAVFTSNFFEHLPDKAALERTVLNAFECLKPGGRLIALGPNIRYTGDAYWDFYDHYVALTDLSLIELLQKSGYEIEYSLSRFLPYTMARGRKFPVWILKVYLLIRLAWPIFGQQFLIVARKPAAVRG
jgi:SAM-dependent methyltransferase